MNIFKTESISSYYHHHHHLRHTPVGGISNNLDDNDDDYDRLNEISTYKNTAANANTSNWTPSSTTAGLIMSTIDTTAGSASSVNAASRGLKDVKTSSSDLTGRMLGTTAASATSATSATSTIHHDATDYGHDYDLTTRLSLRKRDSSLDNRPFRKAETRFLFDLLVIM